MQIDSDEALRVAIAAPSEDEKLEFKSATNTFSKEQVCEYISALANGGGGSLILGVTDQIPRRVEGTKAFANLPDLRDHAYSALRWKIETREFDLGGRTRALKRNAVVRVVE